MVSFFASILLQPLKKVTARAEQARMAKVIREFLNTLFIIISLPRKIQLTCVAISGQRRWKRQKVCRNYKVN
jgi:hypothetical protein